MSDHAVLFERQVSEVSERGYFARKRFSCEGGNGCKLLCNDARLRYIGMDSLFGKNSSNEAEDSKLSGKFYARNKELVPRNEERMGGAWRVT